MRPIRVEISKSTGKVIHIKDGKRTTVTGLPPQANMKAIMARLKAMGLEVRNGVH